MYTDKNDMGLRVRVPGVAPELAENPESGDKAGDASPHVLRSARSVPAAGNTGYESGGAGSDAGMRRLLSDASEDTESGNGESAGDAVMGYDQQMATLTEAANKLKPETEEERKKRERQERSRKIVAAVSDGLQALGNLYFTAKGAPDMYDHETMSQQKPLRDKLEKLEKLRKEREANADRYLQYSLKIGDLKNDRARTVREMEERQERMRLAREKARREQEEHGWLADLQPDKRREQAGKAVKAEQEGITATEEAKNAPGFYKAKADEVKARGEAARAKVRGHDAKEFVAYDKSGRAHRYRTHAAAVDAAKRFGTYVPEETGRDLTYRGVVMTDEDGNPEQARTTKSGGYSRKPSSAGGGKGKRKWASGLKF